MNQKETQSMGKAPPESKIAPKAWFRIIWIVFTIIGLFVGIAAGGIVAFGGYQGLGYLYELIGPLSYDTTEAINCSILILLPMLSVMVVGITIGIAQRYCLKNLLPRSWDWVKAYAKGWGWAALVAGLLFFIISWIGSYAMGFYALYFGGFIGGCLGLLVGGISTSITLRSVLKKRIGQSGNFLKFNLLGWAAAAIAFAAMAWFLLFPVIDMSPSIAFPWLSSWSIGDSGEMIADLLYYPFIGTMIIIISGAVVGAITGIPLAHVLGDRIGFHALPSPYSWSRAGRIMLFSLFGIIVCGFLVSGLQPCGWLDRGLDISSCFLMLKDQGTADHLLFSPDGAYLVSWCSYRDSIYLWQLTDPPSYKIIRHDFLSDVHFSPDGSTLISSSKGTIDEPNLRQDIYGEVKLWRIPDGSLLRNLPERHVYDIDISSDGDHLVLGTANGFVHFLDILMEYPTPLYHHNGAVRSVAFSPDGNFIASASLDTIILWQVEQRSIVFRIKDSTEPKIIAFSPQGSLLASGSKDGSVRIRRVSNGEIVMELEGHSGPIDDLVFSPDGNRLATCSEDNDVKIWYLSDGSLEREYKDSQAVAFSPDGTILAISDHEDEVVRLYYLK